MQILLDYIPIILFFIAFKFYGIYIATAVTLAASILQMGIYWLKFQRFSIMHLITFGTVLIMGGATLLIKDPIFIKLKPTVVSWVLAGICFGSQFVTKKTFLQHLLGKKISLPEHAWINLNVGWTVFFVIMGAVNLYVVYNYSTDTWVNFKLFGFMGATLVFSILQSIYLAKQLYTNNISNLGIDPSTLVLGEARPNEPPEHINTYVRMASEGRKSLKLKCDGYK